MATYINSVGSTIYGDVPGEELLSFHYKVMNYAEKDLVGIPTAGLSADVFESRKRAFDGLAKLRKQGCGGGSMGIPTTVEPFPKCTPGRVRRAVHAFRGGAQGVLLSRKYSEMKLTNLKGADAQRIKELGLA